LRPLRSAARVRASAPRAEGAENGAVSGLATVTFQVHRHVEFGDSLCVVGGTDALGNWSPDSCVPMDWTEGDNWKAKVQLPVMEDVEYKYIVKTSDNSEVEWQPGENEVARISGGSDGLEIVDEWVTEESGGEAEAEGEPAVDVDDAVAAGGAAEKDAVIKSVAKNVGEGLAAEINKASKPQEDPASTEDTRDRFSDKTQDEPLQAVG